MAQKGDRARESEARSAGTYPRRNGKWTGTGYEVADSTKEAQAREALVEDTWRAAHDTEQCSTVLTPLDADSCI